MFSLLLKELSFYILKHVSRLKLVVFLIALFMVLVHVSVGRATVWKRKFYHGPAVIDILNKYIIVQVYTRKQYSGQAEVVLFFVFRFKVKLVCFSFFAFRFLHLNSGRISHFDIRNSNFYNRIRAEYPILTFIILFDIRTWAEY